MSRQTRATCLVLATLLSACVPAPASAPAGGAGSETLLSSARTGARQQPAEGALPPGAGLVANNAGNLIGKVKAPATLISDKGLGLIANNGGSIISNNSGGYRTLAGLDQRPLAGVVVELLDGAGQPIQRDGKPMTATTDAEGRYAFEAALGTSNWQVRVALPAGLGQLAAIVPKSGEKREVDLDVVSTLTTTYILEQYVKTQSDAQKTLDKLPPEVEAETRQKAQQALEAGKVALPDSLAPAQVVAAVEALRKQDATFDAQMEAVKKLLVAAGLSDLGNGQVATEVFLPPIQQLLPAPDGAIYLNCGLIWRVGPDGKLTRITGASTTEPLPVDGKPAAEARLRPIRRMALDAKGRLWLIEESQDARLTRLEPDGSLKEIAHGLTNIRHVAPTEGDAFLALSGPRYTQPVTLHEVTPGAAPKSLHVFQGLEAEIVYGSRAMSRDAQGRLVFCGLVGMSVIPKSYRFDPASGALTQLKAAMVDGTWDVAIDAAGRIYYEVKDAKTVRVLSPDGTDAVLPGLTDIPNVPFIDSIATGPGGSVYLVGGRDGNSLYRLENGQRVLVAGKEGHAGASPTSTALKTPESLAVGPAGELFVIDEGAILRLPPGGGTSTLLAAGALKVGEATYKPSAIRRGADGALYVIGTNESQPLFQRVTPLFRLKEGQAPEAIHTPPAEINAYAVAPDGTVYAAEIRHVSLDKHPARVVRRAPSGEVAILLDEDQDFVNQLDVAIDPRGGLLLAGSRKVGDTLVSRRTWRWQTESGAELLPEAALYPDAVDAQGRWYEGWKWWREAAPAIRRWDPATGATEVIAGPGGRFLGGTSVDDGVSKPTHPVFDAQGHLYFLDRDYKQVKRLPAEGL